MHGRRPDHFERETPAAAARQFRYATGLFLGSLVGWAILFGAGLDWVGHLSGWSPLAVAVTVGLELLIGVVFVGATSSTPPGSGPRSRKRDAPQAAIAETWLFVRHGTSDPVRSRASGP